MLNTNTEELISYIESLTVEDKIKLFNASESGATMEIKMIIAVDLKTNYASDARVEKALSNAMREDSQIRELLTSDYFSSKETPESEATLVGVLISFLRSLLNFIIWCVLPWAFSWGIASYVQERDNFDTFNFEAFSFAALSLSLPFLLSKILNIIRYNTEDTGKGSTSYYSGPHTFTQAEIHGDEFFKKVNNGHWRKYYIVALFVASFIPISLFLFLQQDIPAYLVVLGTILSPLSFLVPQLMDNNFLVSDSTISQDYTSTSYSLNGINIAARMKKLDFSVSKGIIFGFIYPVLAMCCVYYSLSGKREGLFALLYLESAILFVEGIIYSLRLKL